MKEGGGDRRERRERERFVFLQMAVHMLSRNLTNRWLDLLMSECVYIIFILAIIHGYVLKI